MNCPDCGCKTEQGICSNCQEELYILSYQSEFIEEQVSDEFAKKAEEQQEYLKKRKEIEVSI